MSLKIDYTIVEMIVDTGASTDILDEATFEKVNHLKHIELQPPTKHLFAHGSESQLKVLGKFEATIEFKGRCHTSTIHVLKGNHGSLLSYKTAAHLGVVDIQVNKVADVQVNEAADHNPPKHDMLVQQYPSLFKGIGKLKGEQVKLHVDKQVTPVAQRARRLPFHLRKEVEKELDHLEQNGIIEKVEGLTPWVSPLVIVPKKNGKVRLCVDMRMPNKAIKRERHPSPTVDDSIHKLNGGTVFSKLDLRSGYHQLALHPESRYITTFATHKGLRRYARLNFGTSSASEIFQNIINELIRDIPGSLNISDDVVVFGKTQADHDRALHAVCQKFSEVNLTLNQEKCEFNKNSITFFGFVFSSKRISPDPTKVEAINTAKPPTSVSGIRTFLGMATYCSKFIPNFSDISQPLRDLTKKNTPFQWGEKQELSFNRVKKMLTSDTVMAYFDANKETELTTDTSPSGLSAILTQKIPGQNDRKIVAYASRALSDAEQ